MLNRRKKRSSPVDLVRRGLGWKSSSGHSLVEFAVLVPILLLGIFSTLEMGRLYLGWVAVQHAARTGARFAVTGQGIATGDRVSLITTAARNAAGPLSGSVTVVVRSWAGTTASGGGSEGDGGLPCKLVEVEVSYSYIPVVPIIRNIMPNPLTLRGKDRKLNEPWVKCT